MIETLGLGVNHLRKSWIAADGQATSSESSSSAAALIEASGVRKSCEIAESKVDFSRSDAASAEVVLPALNGAIADYTQTLALQPDFAAAYTWRGYAYHRHGDTEWAITDYTRALALDQTAADAYIGRGLAYYAQVGTRSGEKAAVDGVPYDDLHTGIFVLTCNSFEWRCSKQMTH